MCCKSLRTSQIISLYSVFQTVLTCRVSILDWRATVLWGFYSFLPVDGCGMDPISLVMKRECQGTFGLSFAHTRRTEIPFLQITFC